MEAVISNHPVVVFLDIIIKSIKLKLCLNSLLQKWKHVNCFWPCLQSNSIREILLKGSFVWGGSLEPVNTRDRKSA